MSAVESENLYQKKKLNSDTMSAIENDTEDPFNSSMPVDPTLIFGPQRDSLYIVLPITIIYALIFITGLFGNIFTCIVIIRNKSMHTATNYYLFSLAISDLLLLVSGMPQEMYSIWSKWPYVFGHTFCLIRGLAAETSTNASVLTITLFTIERYLAICHPFVSHKMSKLSRAIKHVIALWVASLGLALPQALQFGIKDHRGVTMCLQTRVILSHSFEISTFFFFFAPMVLITVLYSLIGLRLKKTSISKQMKEKEEIERHMRFNNRIRRKNSQSTRRVVKMLVAVVVAFFICWAPFHAQRLVAIYGTAENHLARSPVLLFVYSTLTYISGIFYYMSTCINPIFYHIMSNKFREAFKNTMVHWCCRKSERGAMQRCSYTAIAFARNPNGTLHSGNSLRNETPIHIKALRPDSREAMLSMNGHNYRVCDNCGRPVPSSAHFCKSSRCQHNYGSEYKRRHEEISQYQARNKAHLIEMSLVSEKKKSYTSCCSGQESPTDTLTPPTPEATGSSDNKTEFYPIQPEKCFKEFKIRMKQRDKDCG